MGGFFHGLKDAFLSGLDTTTGQSANAERKQQTLDMQHQDQQRQQEFDMKLFDHMNEMGALPVVGGMVKAPMYDTSAPADMPDLVIARPADKTRLFTHKGADGQTVQFEMPDQATQARRQLYQHMQDAMGYPQTQIREAQNQNEAAATEAKTAGQYRGKNTADQEQRQAIGLDVPSALDEVLPGISTGPNGQARKVLPSELDDLTRSAGQFANYTSEAKHRGEVKAVGQPREVTDDNGNVTVVTDMSDGTVKETPLKAKGKTSKGTGGMTPFQQHSVAREDEADVHNRAMVWQNKMDAYEKEQADLSKENIAHGQEMTELGDQLANGELDKKSKAIAIRRKNLLQSLIDGNNEKFKTVESQKKAAQKIKDSIRGANGLDQSPTQAAATPAPKTATRAQIAAAAKKLGVDPAAAEQKYKDLGVSIID